jgi:circadian clock protein KaiC
MAENPSTRLSTGVRGLDAILYGGFVPQRTYLVRGQAGTGKTTLGLHFLAAGAANGEPVLLITFGESEEQIRQNAASIGFDMANIEFLDLSPTSEFFSGGQTYDLFSAADVEKEPITRKIVEKLEAVKPVRVFLDAITQIRQLSRDPMQLQRHTLALFRYFKEHHATLLFTSEDGDEQPDEALRFMCDGFIELSMSPLQRNITVLKFRGSDYHNGSHTMRLTENGMEVYPRLEPEIIERDFKFEPVSSGIAELDSLLHGGLERGTVCLFTGPTGVGKTTLGMQFVKTAAARGERSVLYTFEEDSTTVIERCHALNIPAAEMIKTGMLSIVQMEPLRHTPDEFAFMVRQEVEGRDARIVIIDSISGYRLSLEGEDLMKHLHRLCKYLRNAGTTAIMLNEVHRIADTFQATEIDISYLMDSIVFLRYIELSGGIRRAIGVLKKRVSDFEKTMREMKFTKYGLKIEEPITNIRGILTSYPDWSQSADIVVASKEKAADA